MGWELENAHTIAKKQVWLKNNSKKWSQFFFKINEFSSWNHVKLKSNNMKI